MIISTAMFGKAVMAAMKASTVHRDRVPTVKFSISD